MLVLSPPFFFLLVFTLMISFYNIFSYSLVIFQSYMHICLHLQNEELWRDCFMCKLNFCSQTAIKWDFKLVLCMLTCMCLFLCSQIYMICKHFITLLFDCNFYYLYVCCPYVLLSKVNLFWNIIVREEAQCYALQEEFVADQLFQSSEHSSDDLLWITHSIFSSGKVLRLVL